MNARHSDRSEDEGVNRDASRVGYLTAASIMPVYAIRGIFFILLVGALQYAQDFALPVVIAFILAFTLSPVVRFGGRRGVPSAVTGIGLVLMLVLGTIAGFYALSVPVSGWIDRAPLIGAEIESKLSFIRRPVEALQDAEKQVGDMANNGGRQVVTVEGPNLLTSAASSAFSLLASLTITAVLLAFLLSSGDMFYAKIVRVFDKLTDKKRALRIAHDVERVVSRYLLTITLINATLGLVIGLGLWGLGMPTPYVWGLIAALANFVPYIGAVIGLAAVTAVAFVTFDTLGPVVLIAGFYFMCTFVEGQILTPLIVGRRLRMNAVAVFISVGFWAWVWGIAGALIAVPILVIVKTFADHFDGLGTLSEFLSGTPDEAEDEVAEKPDG